ncbi:MAG TPA: NAD-dependent epimerase/dehydratase family protein [Thermoplasmata archaeon]|nr:NAD-dependent epimerase/dehydratase family protein [Thermoplasmata archaeon]
MTDARQHGPAVVTGGAGAIGSVLVRALLARGREVRVIDNLSSGRRAHLPAGGEAAKLAVVEADLRDPATFQEACAGAAELWHLAANTDIQRGSADPRIDFENGMRATFQALETARAQHIPRFFFASSSAVYGLATVLPTPEEYGPLVPESLYGAAKLAAEGMCAAYAHSYGLQVYVYRFANIIGPGMTHGVLYDFFEKLRRDPTRLEVLGDGRQSKSYLRTEDCVSGMLAAADTANGRYNLFNLGTRDRTSVKEIAEKVVAAHGGGARIEYRGGDRGWTGDVPQALLSIDRIEALGWRPSSSSGGAIDRTVREMVEARRTGA